MSVKTKRVEPMCIELALRHANDKGAIVVNQVDYCDLWDEITSELKPVLRRQYQGAQAISVHDKAVICRDEHEGEPRWVPTEETEQWSH